MLIRRFAARHAPEFVRRFGGEWRAKRVVIRRYPALRQSPRRAIRYALFDRETENFTYDIENREEVSELLATAMGVDRAQLSSYIAELDGDDELRQSISSVLKRRADRNTKMPYGRRLGWYAAIRAGKPALAVETGVHDGLGSAVMLRALERNAREGHDGHLLAFDIRSDVAWLVPDSLRKRYELRIDDAVAGLTEAVGKRRIGFFIHDSEHSYGHETAEFEAVLQLAEPGAILMSDNAHAAPSMRDFCGRHGLTFTFIPERPRDHFYPGAGIGVTVARSP